MAYDYDKLYSKTPDALGPPTDVFVQFFARFDQKHACVLDIGCGQGRDAVFIARMGHSVVGVDLSPHGIRDMETVAQQENLSITGVVADLTTYRPDGMYDVVLIDRTLHMLDQDARIDVLARLLDHVSQNGWVLIADEVSNMPDFEQVIAKDTATWQTHHRMRGYLFTQRA